MMRLRKSRQGGFGAIAAIVILVLLAVLAAGIVSMSTTQSLTVAQDIASARAGQSARAGVEWGVYRALQAGGWCDGSSTVSAALDLSTANGTLVTVSCSSQQFTEGETCSSSGCNAQTVRVYTITAIATQGAVSTAPNYVERRRQTIVVR